MLFVFIYMNIQSGGKSLKPTGRLLSQLLPKCPLSRIPDEGAHACSLAAWWSAKVVGEDVLVTKFRLQVAGSTLWGRIKAPRGWPLRKSQELKSGC